MAAALAPAVVQARADMEAAGAAAPEDAAGSAAHSGAAPAAEPPVASPFVSILQRDVLP